MEQFAVSFERDLLQQVTISIGRLPDWANDRPYCAGQKVLNETTRQIIAQAKANGWNRVPDQVREPGTIEPPCFKPPVNEG